MRKMLIFGFGCLASAAQVDFATDIQPILAARCQTCHGSQVQSGQLRLDSAQALLKGGISGPVATAGKSRDSIIYQRITGTALGPRMPMGGAPLTESQIASLAAWIDEGARVPAAATAVDTAIKKHWAYQPPGPPNPPVVRKQSWIRNEIDRFILARIEKEGMTPSAEAPKTTLLRRLSLDLTGLPPSLTDIEAFLSDSRADAYDRVVDRLLASPHFGERWAQPWLDLARFADSNGYGNDLARSAWLYRDWLIHALNIDMPFDRFTVEQIAGDLLPGATVEQKIATGFHRNTTVNDEGGSDAEEFRMKAVLDRVNTTATVWLGATVGCAQCHNHKYDPFTQEEYYRLAAFFNTTKEEVRLNPQKSKPNALPGVPVPPSPETAEVRRRLEGEIAAAEAELHARGRALNQEQRKWEGEMAAMAGEWTVLAPSALVSIGGARLNLGSDGVVTVSGATRDRDVHVLEAETNLPRITGVRLEALVGCGSGFVLTDLEAEIRTKSSKPRKVEFATAVADSAQPGTPAKYAVDDDPNSGWGIDRSKDACGPDAQLVAIPKAPVEADGAIHLHIRLRYESSQPRSVLGRFRLSVSGSAGPERIVKLPLPLQPAVRLAPADRSPQQQRTLDEQFLLVSEALKPLRLSLFGLRRTWNELAFPTALIMEEADTPRVSHVAVGGNLSNPGKVVSPGVPASLHPWPKDAPLNRLGLAKWLTDPANPLTARVTVNRFWQELFGTGLVETPDDFGTRAAVPVHRDLLDWLAAEFVHGGWSQKRLLRLIVTSATYRQDSAVTADHLAKDPTNRFWARGARFRMPAEMIRDTALAAAGLLARRIGGPSVYPWQPDGVWPNYVPDDVWVTGTSGDQYRRGIYTTWRRTTPYPSFVAFDAPTREICVAKRVRTDTPLQALAALNDPAYFEAARALALRVMTESPAGAVERLRHAFRLCLSRDPSPRESARLTHFLDETISRLHEEPGRAQKIASGRPAGVDTAELAAWTMLANVLFNLDEAMNRQ